MFTFSSTEIPSCPVFRVRDLDAQRVYWLCDLTEALLTRPCVVNSVAGRVASADKHRLLIESVPPDTHTLGPHLFQFLLTAREGRPLTSLHGPAPRTLAAAKVLSGAAH